MKAGAKSVIMVIAIVMLLGGFPLIVFATSGNTEVAGKVYEFDKDSHYEFHEGDSTQKTGGGNTYGTFYLSGDITAVKKIYVGTNNILRAYMTTGLSIPEINSLVADGATIADDGTIQLAAVKPVA